MTQPADSSLNTSVSIARSSRCLHWFSVRTIRGGNHLTTEVGGAKRPSFTHGKHTPAITTVTRALVTQLHLTECTFDLQQWNRRMDASNSHSLEHQKGEIASVIAHTRAARGEKPRHEQKAQQLVSDMWMTNEYQWAGQMVQTHSVLSANQAILQTSHSIGTSCGGKLVASTLLNECTFLPGWAPCLLHGQFLYVNCTTMAYIAIISKTFGLIQILNSKLEVHLGAFSPEQRQKLAQYVE